MDPHFLITHIPLFRNLPSLQLLRIANEASIKTIPPGVSYTLALLKPSQATYILSGFVAIQQPIGSIHPLGPHLYGAGKWLGLNYTVSEESIPWILRIFREAIIVCIPYEPILSLARSNTQLAINLLQECARESTQKLIYSAHMQQLDVEGRLAYFFLYLAREIFHGKRFKVPINQFQIAYLLSTSREVVNRLLTQWRKAELITIEQHELTILNREELEKRASLPLA